MPLPDTRDPRAVFEYFSSEYAQALQAFEAIQKQAATLLVMGYNGDLMQFIDQFIEMSARTRNEALEANEPNFAEWFGELVEKAQALKTTVPK